MATAPHDPPAPGTERSPALARDHDAFQAALSTLITQVDTVSFDIFDTALIRPLNDPADLFLLLGASPAAISLGLDAATLAAARRDADPLARRLAWERHQHGDVTLDDIYAALLESRSLPTSHAPALAAAERSIESSLCSVNPPVLRLFHQARSAGRRCIFISDMFHPAHFLHGLLTRAGYEVDAADVHVSCEYRELKVTGRLFHRVLSRLGLRPDRVLHIGDNPSADVAAATRAGLRATLHPFSVAHRHQLLARRPAPRSLESLWTGTIEAACLDLPDPASAWARYGARAVGPLLAGFTLWLHRRLREARHPTVHFLLRDGHLLRELYEILFAHDPAPPPPPPLHASRRAFVLPLLTVSGHWFDERLLAATTRPVGEFLTRLDLPLPKLLPALSRTGFASPDDPVDSSKWPQLKSLFAQPEVVRELTLRAQVERGLLSRYLIQSGLGPDADTALVDIGWNGTTQKAILQILSAAQVHPRRINGLYLGTFAGVGEHTPPGFSFDSWLTHEGEPRFLASALRDNLAILEVACTNFEGSTRTFRKDSGRIAPVLDPWELDAADTARIRAIHSGAHAFARRLAPLVAQDLLPEVDPGLASQEILRVMTRPSREEADRLGDIAYVYDMGSRHARRLAAFSPTSSSPADLLRDHTNAYWKTGLLARSDPRAPTTRALLPSPPSA